MCVKARGSRFVMNFKIGYLGGVGCPAQNGMEGNMLGRYEHPKPTKLHPRRSLTVGLRIRTPQNLFAEFFGEHLIDLE